MSDKGDLQHTLLTLVEKSIGNPAEFRNYSNSGPFELWNFHQNFIFPIVKCVPANSDHESSGLESSPAIDSSNFMNWKTFLPSGFCWPAKMMSIVIGQPVDLMMPDHMDIGTIPGNAISLSIYHLLNMGRCDFCEQNNHFAKITSTALALGILV